MKIAGTNFAFVWTETLDEGFGHLADHGIDRVELTLTLPHINLNEPTNSIANEVNDSASRYGITFTSLNPVEMNLISANKGIADTTLQELLKAVDLAAAIGAPTLVVVPGRFNTLCPMDLEVALTAFRSQMAVLLEHAAKRDVKLALENTPFGFLQTPLEILEEIRFFDHEQLGMVVDAANLHFVGGDISEIAHVADHIILAHVSDTDRTRFAHNYIGEGDVDFKAFADALKENNYAGETVYELVVPNLDWSRWKSDFAVLRDLGWS